MQTIETKMGSATILAESAKPNKQKTVNFILVKSKELFTNLSERKIEREVRKARIKRLKEEAKGAELPANYSPFFLTTRKKGGSK